MLNPFTRIRELEALLLRAEQERLQACDELRRVQSLLDATVESERQARSQLIEHCHKIEDWMASLMRQPGIHNKTTVAPAVMPTPASYSRRQGAELEREMVERLEKEFLAN